MPTTTEDVVYKLQAFPRRNRDTGAMEELRITAGEFNGRLVTSVRVWYPTRHTGPDDDGFRPSKVGVTLREAELDLAIAALERARELIQGEGRSTNAGPSNPPPRRKPGRAPDRGGWTPTPHAKRPSCPTPEFDEFGGLQ